ncbi:MAG: aspartate dehydrogenase [Rhodospirillales bacterium]|nr:aspartate dehydrogenase [Rhodospirillales bacterium]
MALKVAICGLGAVGMPVARWLDTGVDGLALAAVSARDQARARGRVSEFRNPPPVLSFEQLPEVADVIVECAPPALFAELAEATLRAGKIYMPLSVTSLLPRMDLIDLAKQMGTRIIIPTGAIVGLDAVRAAAYGEIYSVVMKTRKPPKSLRDAKFVVEQGYDLDALTEPLMLYSGTVAEAASMFPANVNIAVALAFAGIGPERTLYEIWADPGVDRNSHTVSVDACSTRFDISIAGVPTLETPGTGKLTPLSVMATLEGLVTSFRVGT